MPRHSQDDLDPTFRKLVSKQTDIDDVSTHLFRIVQKAKFRWSMIFTMLAIVLFALRRNQAGWRRQGMSALWLFGQP